MDESGTRLLDALLKRSTQRDRVKALRQAMRRGDVEATADHMIVLCAEQGERLQDLFFLNGPKGRLTRSHLARTYAASERKRDLFTWLKPKADALMTASIKPDALPNDSLTAVARFVLTDVKRPDFGAWQAKDDRRKWTYKSLTSDWTVREFATFLKPFVKRQRLVDPRISPLPDKRRARRIDDPLMREIHRREFQALLSDPHIQRLAKRTRSDR